MSTVVEAYDEGNANLSAVVQTHSQYGKTAVVQSVNLAKAGRRGFMGFAKKPNLYDVKVFHTGRAQMGPVTSTTVQKTTPTSAATSATASALGLRRTR